jgi:hypothetical protein
MTNKLKISLLAFMFFLGSSLVASAQIKSSAKKKPTETTTPDKKDSDNTETEETKPTTTTSTKKKTDKKTTDKYFDESGGFKHRLWYGASGALNFYGLGENAGNVFTIGLTPMVGYKIIGNWSAGPRVGVTYTNISAFDTKNVRRKVGLLDFSMAAFSRYKIDFFPQVFAHVEYEYMNRQDAYGDQFGRIQLDAEGNVAKARQSRTNGYVGLGYNAGGLVSYEFMALYNLSLTQQERDANVSPINIRAGFTYKF